VIRVVLPSPLRTLARVDGEVEVNVEGDVTLASVLDALEAAYPALRGTVRDQRSGKRRPFIRFYVGEEDLSHEPPIDTLPEPVAAGAEPLVIVGAMSGG
jgi:molybdopterin synthase sulfur carrier subunit